MRGIALFSLLVLASGPALAAADTAATTRASGDWRLSEVGGKIACTLTLTRQTNSAGFELRAPLACRRAFPALKAVANWALDDKGGIVLSDGRAQPIVTFPTQSKGPYEAKAPDGRTWRLEPVKPTQPTPDEAPIRTAPPIG
jgi:Protease inhibitor Inh